MKNSAVEKAWEEYFSASKLDDLESLQKEGWRTVEDVARLSGRSRVTVAASPLFDHKKVKLASSGGHIRTHTLLRPKIKG